MPRTVQLSDPAYAALAAAKEAGESFSEVVLRLLSERKDPRALLEFGPTWEGYDYDDLDQKMRPADQEKLSGILASDRGAAPYRRRKRE